MLAKAFPELLPPMSEEESIEVTKIHSVAGLIEEEQGLQTSRPFRSPHHTVTSAAMLGGGTPVKPGEISLAHHGVLFLDEFLEFNRSVIEGLREPLEDKKITLSRHQSRYTFPSQFLLIIALNPCPCGFYGYETTQRVCHCSASQIERYRHKLSGPIYDRIDLHIDVPLMDYDELRSSQLKTENTHEYTTFRMKNNIAKAILYKQKRGALTVPNGLLKAEQVERECILTEDADLFLKKAYKELHFSARGYHKILKIGRTIADLNHTELIDVPAIAEAIQYRTLDRQ